MCVFVSLSRESYVLSQKMPTWLKFWLYSAQASLQQDGVFNDRRNSSGRLDEIETPTGADEPAGQSDQNDMAVDQEPEQARAQTPPLEIPAVASETSISAPVTQRAEPVEPVSVSVDYFLHKAVYQELIIAYHGKCQNG